MDQCGSIWIDIDQSGLIWIDMDRFVMANKSAREIAGHILHGKSTWPPTMKNI